jgi:UDP-N-acetylmuramate--alanine ligase
MLKEDIAKPFYLSDMIVLTDIFPAFEKPIEGVSGEKIYEWLKILNPEKEIVFVKDKRKIPFYLKEKLMCGDLIVLLGPGDICTVAEEIFKILKESKNEEIS